MNDHHDGFEIPRDDPRIIACSAHKRDKIRKLLEREKLSGIILSRRDNFAWISTGGNATVINSTQDAIGCILITADKHYFICHTMDGRRILEEQLPGQGYELIELNWFETNPLEKSLHLSGRKPGVDVCVSSGQIIFDKILDLHYPMTEFEFERLEWLGRTMNNVFNEIARSLMHGMSEVEIAALFESLHVNKGIKADVIIAGSDERCFKYRHPMPSNQKVQKYLMLHSAANRWGLHAPITRLFSFGKPSQEISKAYQAVARIQAGIIAMLKPGLPYIKLFTYIKNAYKDFGYPGEWRSHFQGGPTGYVIVDGKRLLSNKVVQRFTPFEWFSTVPGAKIAELVLLRNNRPWLASILDPWPIQLIDIEGQTVKMPNIYIVE